MTTSATAPYSSVLYRNQRGAASVAIVMLLMFILAAAVGAMLSMSSSSVVDAAKNEEQVAALFLAESGLERAQAKLYSASSLDNMVCTNIADGVSYSLGLRGGTFITSTAISCDTSATPVCGGSCSNGTCGSCKVTVTGKLGTASRTITRTISLTQANGTACNGSTASPDCSNLTANPPTVPPTWSLTLTNPTAYPAVALFHLAATRRGNQSGAGCTASSNCNLQWNVNAQNGNNSVLSMGNLYTIASGGTSQTVYQKLDSSNSQPSVAEVGVLFPGTSTPSIVGAYWDDKNGSTIGKTADSAGYTNNGTFSSAGTCSSPTPSSTQSCNNWCYGGDTLVYGFSGHSSSGLTDILSNVFFNTAGTPVQNVALTSLTHFPTSASPGAPTDIYSEIWYAYNPKFIATAGSFVVGEKYVIQTLGKDPTSITDFTSIGAASNTIKTAFVATGAGSGTGTATPLNPFATSASSYKGNGTAAIGASWTGGSNTTCNTGGNCVAVVQSTWSGGTTNTNYTSEDSTTLTVGTPPNKPIYPGATITHTGGGGGLNGSPYIVRQLTGILGGIGTYELNISQTGDTTSGNWTAYNSILTVGSFSGYPDQIITPRIMQNTLAPIIISSVGDVVSSSVGSGNISNVTIALQVTSIESGGILGGRGTYSLISTGTGYNVSASSSRKWTTASNILNVSNCIICFIENNDAITNLIANKKISSQLSTINAEVLQGVGRYVLTSSGNPALPTTVASASTLRVYSGANPAVSPARIIYLPSSSSLPTVTTPNTRIAIVSGTGTFVANTTVTAVTSPAPNTATNSFTVSTTPTAALNVATICGGACAFFNQPSNVASTTTFSIGKPANTDYWASGFMCLTGSDITPTPVTSSTVKPSTWHELVK